MKKDWLHKMADLEDKAGSISVGGLAKELGMLKKVYCQDCKHCFSKLERSLFSEGNRYYCKLTKVINDSYICQYVTYTLCARINLFNTCKDFEQKKPWWKFW